jgi:hypothetical protein
MNVHVNQSRANNLAPGVEGAVGLRRGMRPHAEHVLAANPQVGDLIYVLGGIDDPTIGDAEGNHSQ